MSEDGRGDDHGGDDGHRGPGADGAADGGPDGAADGGPDALSPRQRETLERLRARPATPPTFAPDVGERLRSDLEDALGGTVSGLPDDATLLVNKHALATIHGCEARWHAEDLDPGFTPSAPVVQGSVAHKAIELALNWTADRPVPPSGELVDLAIDSLCRSDAWMAEWLRTCDDVERAEVRGAAAARVSQYEEVWPPLRRAWRPATEVRVRADLVRRRVTLAGRVDLTVGRAEGRTPGKVIVDFKTGGFSLSHVDDLRFYALVETLKLGVPPRALASSYLESGDLHVEAVTEDVLDAAVARVVDAAQRMVAIRHHDHPPVARPSGACRWCRARDTCAPGRAHLAELQADAW